jgi:S-DNA-T family DNA segregation ATPase FtsK/SpoIIIE
LEDDSSAPDPTQDADAALIDKITKYLETQEKTSTSKLQRKFRIGYNRAARIMDQLEENGMVSPMDGSNKRRVLIWKE